MVLLVCLLLPAVAYVIGKWLLRVFYGSSRELVFQDFFIVGGITIIGLAEAAHVVVAFFNQPLSKGTLLFGVALVCFAAAALVLLLWKRGKKELKEQGKVTYSARERLLFSVFLVLVILQIVYVAVIKPVYLNGDMTLETVQSFLETDAAYQVNPMTGQAYELGIPSRLKLLCLPTLYAMLSSIFRVEAVSVVWVVAPVFTLFGFYLVYSVLAGIFFSADRWQRICFLALTALLIWVGDYMLSVDGFDLLHAGYRGVTIRGAVLVPYTIAAVLRKKWKLVILCILAEACMVWTLYGMGACLLVAAALWITDVLLKKYQRNHSGKGD